MQLLLRYKKYRETLASELIFLLLAIISIGLLFFEFTTSRIEDPSSIISRIDLLIALVFFTDFVLGLISAESKRKYFRSEWYMLLASIPLTNSITQALRSVRLIRLVRIVRIISRLGKLGAVADENIDESSRYIYAISMTFTVLLTAATAFFSYEYEVNPRVDNFFDAIWWASVTATTVGYGEIVPYTWQGRVIAMLLMFFGIGLVGTVAGFVGTSLLKPKKKGKI